MNPISGWLCTNTTKNLFIKIVHPGGRVELHDRPILAAELLTRNPKCCVAHPTVFQQPFAVVSPTAMLALGQKYYVVPIATIRKLQLKYSPSQNTLHGEKDKEILDSTCWLMRKNGKKNSGIMIKVRRSKNSKGFGEKDCKGVGNGGARLSPTSLDNWQPGLEIIIEE
ncbi:hypothetical protein BUALT_Bualt07G0121600 [Buddleja alternifolia]|uniref:Uncharacterized protein n=1 Tax=Buddleja alternifolia TaxID=168488 RepID=A0AAV6XKW0_9LAMI|nr:hypothetical protein BUALT_Bualt07G0121600 [Buddleja alternifolia]